MDYFKIYGELLQKINNENRRKHNGVYYENHHIIPKCVGGDNSKNNLVLMTSREHFLAHWMLVKMYPNNFKLVYAFNCFSLNNKGDRPCSRYYEYARKRYIKALTEDKERIRLMANTMKGKIWIKKDGECLRVTSNEIDEYLEHGWSRGRIIKKRRSPSKLTRDKIRDANTGKKYPNRANNGAKINSYKIWITDGEVNKFLHVDVASRFLLDGYWSKGRTYTNWNENRKFKGDQGHGK